jgi:hypothetical protein
LTKLEALLGTTGSTVVPARRMARIAVTAMTIPVILNNKVINSCPGKVKLAKVRYLLDIQTNPKWIKKTTEGGTLGPMSHKYKDFSNSLYNNSYLLYLQIR